jgi:hypothetical protein
VQRWSDPATWGGAKPTANAAVLIPAGKKILLDENTPDLAGLTIDGELIAEEQRSVTLTADYILLRGSLRAGTAGQPYTGRLDISLNATDTAQTIETMGTRGILVMGGRLELYGAAPATAWTKISDHIEAGTNSFSTLAAQGWKPGDQIVLAPTDFYGVSATERLALASVSGTRLTTTTNISAFRWGKLQHLTATGMSLTPQAGFAPRTAGTPTTLDQRAAVGNLSRNISISAADDNLWRTQGFGAHVMIMGPNSVTQLQGVEVHRAGQAGRSGRYPIHFHQLSYDSAGNEVAAGANSQRVVKNSAIWNSANRCITIHGSNGATLDNNICHDIAGHAVFLEDAVERKNTITNNLVLKVRLPANPLIDSDKALFTRGSSGFWLTHPDNTVTGNLAADSQGNGFWMAFPAAPLGINKQVRTRPSNALFGVFDNNVTHSNNDIGIQFDWVPFNDAGETQPHKYVPTSDQGPDRYDENRVRFRMTGNVSYKNRGSGFWNRVSWPDYPGWTSADNMGRFFAGAGDDGKISRALVIGESLNNRTSWRTLRQDAPPAAFASYHSTFDMFDNTVVNMAHVPGYTSGVFATEDYYIRGVDRGMMRNPNNQLINSHPGFRYPVQTQQNWTIAGALWDPHGYFGPAGNYWTYDNAFLTTGASCQDVAPAGSNGKSCTAEYYGVGGFVVDNSQRYLPLMPLRVTRYNDSWGVIGTWEVGDGTQAPMLGNMRHFSAMKNGRYLIQFPNYPIPALFSELEVENAFRSDDQVLLGIPFSGSSAVARAYTRAAGTQVNLTASTSRDAVLAGNGTLYWHDIANHTVWIKARTPNGAADAAQPSYADRNLYRGFMIRIER